MIYFGHRPGQPALSHRHDGDVCGDGDDDEDDLCGDDYGDVCGYDGGPW
jgi:hypothetical protein